MTAGLTPDGLRRDDLGRMQVFDDIIVDGERVAEDTEYMIDYATTTSETGDGYEIYVQSFVYITEDGLLEFALQFNTDTAGTGLLGSITEFAGIRQDSQTFEWMTLNRREIEDQFNSTVFEYTTGIDLETPFDEIEDMRTMTLEIDPDENTSDTTSMPFRQIPLPNIDALRGQIENLDPMEVVAVAHPENPLEGFMAEVFGVQTLTLEIPPSVFVRWVDVEDLIPCLEEYSGIVDDIDRLSYDISDVGGRVSNVRSDLDGIMERIAELDVLTEGDVIISEEDFEDEDLFDEIDDATGGLLGDTGSVAGGLFGGIVGDDNGEELIDRSNIEYQDVSGMANVDIDDFKDALTEDPDFDIQERDITEWQDTLDEARDVVDEYDGLLREIDSIEEEIQAEVSDDCVDEVLEEFDNATANMPDMAREVSVINTFTQDFGFIDRLDFQLIDDRFEVPRSLLNQVDAFIDDVNAVDPPILEEDFLDLRDQGQDVIDEIEDELSEENPRKGELLSDVRDHLSILEDMNVLEDIEVPDDLQQRVDDFVDSVNELEGPITRDTLDDLRSEGNSLISDIEDELQPENPNKEELVDTVRDAISVVEDIELIEDIEIPEELEMSVEDYLNLIESLTPPLTVSRRDEIIRDGEELIDDIREELPSGHPDKDSLVDSVESAISQLNDFHVLREEDVPCSETYPEIDSMIEEMEVTISNIRRQDVDPDGTIIEPVEGFTSIGEVFDEIDDIAERVEQEVQTQRCIRDFRERVDSLSSQATARMTGIRVDDETLQEIEERRQELEGRLGDVMEGIEDISGNGDVTDGDDEGDQEDQDNGNTPTTHAESQFF